ncbi:MAG TPA: hypothetical protein VJU13_07805 [Candidatus Nitrosocosmicus sp.]|nr:hypothetical protein [Candidatus Nitrosocosmicus sp.]
MTVITTNDAIISMHPEDAAKTISEYDYGLHCLVIYSDLSVLRQFYSHYIPQQINYKKEIIQILPFYETEESVRRVLCKGNKGMNMNKTIKENGDGIGDEEGEQQLKENSLLIIDSLGKYGGQKNAESIWNAIEELVKYANGLGKKGVSNMGDMGSFLFGKRVEELVNYELSLPRRFEINLKGICLYHHKDFDRVSEDHKQTIINQHEIAIRI